MNSNTTLENDNYSKKRSTSTKIKSLFIDKDTDTLNLLNIGLTIISFIFIVFLLNSIFYKIPSGSVGLIRTFGVYNESVKNPGLHTKIPFISSITKVDIKSKIVHYGREDSGEKVREGVRVLPDITVLDKKNLTITAQLSIRYRLNSESVYDIFTQDGNNYFDKRLNPVILETVRNVLGGYAADEVTAKRSDITKKIKDALVNKLVDSAFGIEEITFRRFILDNLIRTRIQKVEAANQREKELVMEVKQAEQSKQKLEIEAQAIANKAKIEAEGKAEAILTEAKAVAKANILINRSLSTKLIEYNKVKKWDGKVPGIVAGEGGLDLLLDTRK